MQIQFLLALIAGASMPLAFAPFAIWPIALLAPAVLIYQSTLFDQTRQNFMLGFSFGLGYFGFGVSWIYHSLHVFGHAPAFVAGGLTLLMIVVLSCFIGSVLALFHRLKQRHPSSINLWLLPLLWFSLEWLKGWVLTGFPWLSLGYAHLHSPLSGLAPIVGVYGVGSVSLLISVFLVKWKLEKSHVYALPVIMIGLMGYGLQHLEWTKPSGQTLDIALVQGNIDQDKKWRRDERLNILSTFWNATKKTFPSDLIVWPEVAIPGRQDELNQSVLLPISEQMKNNNSQLLTGILVSDLATGGYYNSMIMLGEKSGQYHKRHLVPFGEYYPFRDLLQFMKQFIRIPMTDTLSGDDVQPLMSIKGVKLGVSICFEDVFSRDINLDLPEANILINTSNDAWFGDSLAPHQHLEIAQMRSLETERPMVRATNTGKSAFIDFKGKLMSETEQFKEQTLSATVQGRAGATPFIFFEKIQSWLAWIILITSVYFAYRPERKA